MGTISAFLSQVFCKTVYSPTKKFRLFLAIIHQPVWVFTYYAKQEQIQRRVNQGQAGKSRVEHSKDRPHQEFGKYDC